MLFVKLIVNIVCTYMCMWAHSAMTKVCKSEVNFAESVFFYFYVRSRDHQLVCYFCIITKFCRHDVMLMVTSTWEAETRKRVAVSTTWRCVLGGLCVWCLELNVYAFTSLFYHWAICSALKVEQLELRTQSGASHPQWTFPPAMAQPCYLSWDPSPGGLLNGAAELDGGGLFSLSIICINQRNGPVQVHDILWCSGFALAQGSATLRITYMDSAVGAYQKLWLCSNYNWRNSDFRPEHLGRE